MNQGTIYRRLDNPDYPYFIISQSDQLSDLNTRAIIPFIRWRQNSPGMSRINPTVLIEDEKYILMTHLMQTIYAHELDDDDKHSYCPELRDIIVNAVDFLVTGS